MPKQAAPEVQLTQEAIDAIQAWQSNSQQLEQAKTAELASRLHVIKTVPFNADKEEGGQTIKLGAGWKLGVNKPVNLSADKDNQVVVAAMTALNAVNPSAAADLIRWEAVISTGAYKKLTDDEKKIVAAFITSKPGTPSLELKPPAPAKA